MIKLKDKYRRSGMDISKVYENDNMYIYSTYIDGWFNSYELFFKRIYKPDKFHDDEHEKYPSDESFGTLAWSCSSENSVRKILKRKFKYNDYKISQICSTVIRK